MALRAPETILGDRLGKGIDIWCFGCLVFEMLLGRSLFVNVQPMEGKAYDEISNDEHLIQLWEVIGPLPNTLCAKWRRADQYLSPDGERLEVSSHEEEYGSEDDITDESSDQDLGQDSDDGLDDQPPNSPVSNASGSSEPLYLASPDSFLSLEDQFEKKKPSCIDESEGKEILHLLRWIFQYDPAKRPSAQDIIKHPWFSL